MDKMDKTIRELYKEYYTDVKDIVESIASEFMLTSFKDFQDNEDTQSRLHEMIDSSAWVIYTYNAKLVAVLSENADAYQEYTDDYNTPESVAYCAMEADAYQLLDNEYFWKDFNSNKGKE